LQEWFELDKSLPYFCAVFDPEITDYYSWTIPKDGSVIVGAAFLPKRGCRSRFELLKQKMPALGFRLGRSVRRDTALLLRPTAPGQIETGSGKAALIGEAAGWISPSSAEGLSYALRSAMMMAGALRDYPEGFLKRYQQRTRALHMNVLLKNAKASVIYNPFLRGIVMRSGLGTVTLP
jgi:flavin-dependent dehydrogenase